MTILFSFTLSPELQQIHSRLLSLAGGNSNLVYQAVKQSDQLSTIIKYIITNNQTNK